jgi:hypothetical protein
LSVTSCVAGRRPARPPCAGACGGVSACVPDMGREAHASGGQALAPLGPTTCQHAASTCGLHALTKAVAPLANETARLVGALHFCSPVSRRRYRFVDAMRTAQSDNAGWPRCAVLARLELSRAYRSQRGLKSIQTNRGAATRHQFWSRPVTYA